MTISLSPTQSDTTTALRSFLMGTADFVGPLPAGVDVVLGQANRAAEPSNTDYVVMTPIRRPRLSTNFDTFVDAKFTGSIATAGSPAVTTMTITHVFYGALKVGSVVFGVGVTKGTQVLAQTGGTPGGIGTYTVNNAQTVLSETLAAGVLDMLQAVEVTIQCDVHGPNSADNSTRISTMFRDDYAVQAFHAINPNITPFYADDPKQIPFQNAEQQWEWRWVVDACLQVNATVSDIPQEFFDSIVTTLIPADAVYPA